MSLFWTFCARYSFSVTLCEKIIEMRNCQIVAYDMSRRCRNKMSCHVKTKWQNIKTEEQGHGRSYQGHIRTSKSNSSAIMKVTHLQHSSLLISIAKLGWNLHNGISMWKHTSLTIWRTKSLHFKTSDLIFYICVFIFWP